MEIKEVRYKRRKNLGNHEFEEVELVADLQGRQNSMGAIAALKEKAELSLGIIVPEEIPFK